MMQALPSSLMRAGARQRGFTLVELMVAVVVLAILAALAVPSFTRIINSTRIGSQTNDMLATLQYARSEALRSNRRVTVCQSSNAGTCAAGGTHWIVLSGGEVQRGLEVQQPLRLTGTAATFDYLPSGMAAAQQTFTVCLPVTNPEENSRLIRVARSGQVSVERQSTAGVCS